MTYERDLANRAARAGIYLPGQRSEVLDEIIRLRRLERATGLRVYNDELPAYSSSGGATIDTNPGDYPPIGDTFILGVTGQAADAGTQWQHGQGLSPDDHLSRELLAADFGFKVWTGSYWQLSSGQLPNANGTVQVVRLKNPLLSLSVTNVHLIVQTGGSGLTSGQNFAALADSNRVILGTSADQTTPWASIGVKTMALTGGPFTVTTATFFVVFFGNGTTLPKFLGGGLGSTLINGLLSAANSFWATADTGRTTSFPSTLAALSQSNAQPYWAAVS